MNNMMNEVDIVISLMMLLVYFGRCQSPQTGIIIKTWSCCLLRKRDTVPTFLKLIV